MWNPVTSSLKFVQALDTYIQRDLISEPNLVPDLSSGEMLLAASDYAGTHRRYDVVGCVVTSYDAWKRWEPQRVKIRQSFRLGRRRVAYAKLNDKHKLRALPIFLHTASTLEGVLCCVAINKEIPSLVDADGTAYVHDAALDEWRCWKPHVFERMLRAAGIVSMLVAGLASPGQKVGWVTDEDEIAANDQQLGQLARAFGAMVGRHSSGRIPNVLVSTTAEDPALEGEDLASVADLAAGAIADVFSEYDRAGLRLANELTLPVPTSLPSKTHQIGRWLRMQGQPLRRLLFVAEKGPNYGDVQISRFNFT